MYGESVGRQARRAINVLFLVLITVAKLMIVGMTLLIGLLVFMRYVMGSGIRWANEFALVLQVWFTFIAMALGVRKGLHISINIMPQGLSGRVNWVLSRLHALAIIGVGVVMVVYGEQLVVSTMRSVLPALGLRSGYLYLALPVGGALIVLESILNLFGIDRKDDWLAPYIGEEAEEIPAEDVEATQAALIRHGSDADQQPGTGKEEHDRG
ncbi:MAG: TRAP transporter small permease [Spirochaetia bacterium]